MQASTSAKPPEVTTPGGPASRSEGVRPDDDTAPLPVILPDRPHAAGAGGRGGEGVAATGGAGAGPRGAGVAAPGNARVAGTAVGQAPRGGSVPDRGRGEEGTRYAPGKAGPPDYAAPPERPRGPFEPFDGGSAAEEEPASAAPARADRPPPSAPGNGTGHGPTPVPAQAAAAAKLDQIKDLYLTAEAIGEDALSRHFEQVSERQRQLIREYFDHVVKNRTQNPPAT